MPLSAIQALPVASLFKPDAAIALWFPQHAGQLAYATVAAWGFVPKSLGAWAKQSKTGTKLAFGNGKIPRCAAEFFLIATRGSRVCALIPSAIWS
jgi:N6-adenosine-specific RNA methylase IME4